MGGGGVCAYVRACVLLHINVYHLKDMCECVFVLVLYGTVLCEGPKTYVDLCHTNTILIN